MKVFLKNGDWGKFKKGDAPDLTAVEAVEVLGKGIAITIEQQASEAQLTAVQAKQVESRITAIKTAVKNAKTRNAILPKDDAVEAKAIERFTALGAGEEAFAVICETIDAIPAKDMGDLTKRAVQAHNVEGVGAVQGLQMGEMSLKESAKGYIQCQEQIGVMLKAGDTKGATAKSREASAILASGLMRPIRKGDDYMLRDAVDPVQAADYTDPNSQVGTLATGLVLMRNLGFLKNKMPWLPHLTTDLRNEPAMFGQPVLTRYVSVPAVATFIPGIGFTTDAGTIAAASAGSVQSGIVTQTSGTRTLSAPSTTDVTVTMDQFKGVPIGFPITTLAATARNLFSEQRDAQLYSLAETVNQFVLAKLFAATWTGIVKGLTLGSGFALPGMITLKNRMTLAKIPDVGRFALLNSVYHDALLSDTNLLSAKAILALINKDASAFEQGDVPALFGVKPLESQLASYKTGVYTAPTINADTGAVDFATPQINQIGFAGNQSSGVFVARVPQDFTKVAAALGIPQSWATEIITEPDSGLSVMIFKNVNTATWQIEATVCLMYGMAQGDSRVGIVLAP